jgi:hypothetical protein
MGGIEYDSYDVLLAAYFDFGQNGNNVTAKNVPINSDKNRLE